MPQTRALDRAVHFIEVFREVDKEMPMQIAYLFLLIARKPGVNLRELVQASGMGKSSVSRNVALLSQEYGGKGLVSMKEDLQDRRNRVVTLTPKGEHMLKTLLLLTDGGA